MVTIAGIPVYDATISGEDCGMFKISLVDDPAVQSNFLKFSSNKQMQMYAVADEEKRIVIGCVMRADFPIYRRDDKNGEYYVIYKADTIREMAEKYLLESRQNNVNLMHEEGSDVEGVQMVQYFIKDTEKGINPASFDDISEGSLFAEFHITNDEVWEAVKDGTYKGFSLEGVFDMIPEQDKTKVEEIVDTLEGKFSKFFNNSTNKSMGKFKKFKDALAYALAKAEMGSMTTDKGVLAWDGEEDLKVGDAVFVEDAEGNRTPAEDGEYKTDEKVYVVTDGKVAEINDAVVEQTPAEMASVSTDKGELHWDGDADLKEGDAVFTIGEDGEKTPAEDGEYKTEDGKTIVVKEGVVAQIKDAEAEVAPTEEEMKMHKQTFFSKVKEAFADTYEEKVQKIYEAIVAKGYTDYGYIASASDEEVVYKFWDGTNNAETAIQFPITWDAEGNPIIGEGVEVKEAFVPVDEPAPAENPADEEVETLRKENAELKAQIAKFSKEPFAKPAHEEVQTAVSFTKTGDKGLDRLAERLSLIKK